MNQEQGNSAASREITLQNTDMPEAHVHMVPISNTERKLLKVKQDIPPAHNLLNCIMNSGTICHMIPTMWISLMTH